jgi:hypothetical protein
MDYQVQRKGDKIILGLELQGAVMDIVTDTGLLKNCLRFLTEPHEGIVYTKMGKFGRFSVSLNVDADDIVSIFIDGPDFDRDRVQSSAIWPGKESLRKIIQAIIEDGQ